MALDFSSFQAWLEADSGLPFDMHSQAPEDWLWLKEVIPSLIVSSAGGIVPFQAEGLLYELPFYYRDRHGHATLSVGEKDGKPPYSGNAILYSASTETEEFSGGAFFVKNLLKLVPELTKSPFPYEFESKKIAFLNNPETPWSYEILHAEREVHVSWGDDPEDAYLKLMNPNRYLESYGAKVELQLKWLQEAEINPLPINRDQRNFPAVAPEFKVNLTGN